MKKNKGFMLLETLIVSTIIISALIVLFVQFTSVKTSYEVSFTHNTIPGIYLAKELSDFIIENELENELSNKLDNETNGYIEITSASIFSNTSISTTFYNNMINNMNIKKVLYVSDNLDTLKNYLKGNNVSSMFTEKFKEFILSLKTNNSSSNRLIIMFNDDTFASIIVGVSSSSLIYAEQVIFDPEDESWDLPTTNGHSNVWEALEWLRNN